MTALAETLCRSYSMHGVGIDVKADDPAVLAAMDHRLRNFETETSPSGLSMSFEFLSTAPPMPATTAGRPVYETPHGTLHYLPDHDLLTGELGGVALHCEPAKGRAVIAAPSFSGRALYFATHPVATVALMEMMERLDRYSLHAGCLAEADGRGVLLCGVSGAGKSTLALAMARAGMEFLGDDIVFLRPRSDDTAQLQALGFPDTIGISDFTSSRFPELKRFASAPRIEGFPKRLHGFEQLFDRPPAATCIPKLVVFPEVRPDAPSAITPIDRGEALVRLVPDVLLTHERSTQAHISAIAELLGQAECHVVHSGRDIEGAADLVRRLL